MSLRPTNASASKRRGYGFAQVRHVVCGTVVVLRRVQTEGGSSDRVWCDACDVEIVNPHEQLDPPGTVCFVGED